MCDIEKSLLEELKKATDSETTVEIRLYDDKTGRAFYKQLTRKELNVMLSLFKNMEWR